MLFKFLIIVFVVMWKCTSKGALTLSVIWYFYYNLYSNYIYNYIFYIIIYIYTYIYMCGSVASAC